MALPPDEAIIIYNYNEKICINVREHSKMQ